MSARGYALHSVRPQLSFSNEPSHIYRHITNTSVSDHRSWEPHLFYQVSSLTLAPPITRIFICCRGKKMLVFRLKKSSRGNSSNPSIRSSA